MYAGHFAAGLAIKAREPRAPTWGLLLGVGVLDLLFGPFVLAGWDGTLGVRLALGTAPRGARTPPPRRAHDAADTPRLLLATSRRIAITGPRGHARRGDG